MTKEEQNYQKLKGILEKGTLGFSPLISEMYYSGDMQGWIENKFAGINLRKHIFTDGDNRLSAMGWHLGLVEEVDVYSMGLWEYSDIYLRYAPKEDGSYNKTGFSVGFEEYWSDGVYGVREWEEGLTIKKIRAYGGQCYLGFQSVKTLKDLKDLLYYLEYVIRSGSQHLEGK